MDFNTANIKSGHQNKLIYLTVCVCKALVNCQNRTLCFIIQYTETSKQYNNTEFNTRLYDPLLLQCQVQFAAVFTQVVACHSLKIYNFLLYDCNVLMVFLCSIMYSFLFYFTLSCLSSLSFVSYQSAYTRNNYIYIYTSMYVFH